MNGSAEAFAAGDITVRAADAALAAAEPHLSGLGQPRFLGGYSNLLYKMEPFPVVARVAAATGNVRPGTDWMAREVAVGQYLAARKAPAARPSPLLPPGPHVRDGLALTFWEFAEISADAVGPEAAGAALRALHDALAACAVALPALAGLAETWRLLERPQILAQLGAPLRRTVEHAVRRVQSRLAGLTAPFRPLHGDAHHGNLWCVQGRPLWGDLEDAQGVRRNGIWPASRRRRACSEAAPRRRRRSPAMACPMTRNGSIS
ncbi:MAG: phosphotransferase [Rhizomicrobium sp.]